jgi:thiamine-monophosphate kinase
MIDVSDGLLADLGHVAAASGVHINLNGAALAPDTALREAAALLHRSPVTAAGFSPGPNLAEGMPPGGPREDLRTAAVPASPAANRAAASAAMALNWVLTGGEDHSLVAALPPGTVLPERWRVIGEVTAGVGVTVDGVPHQGPAGWQHFR